MVGIPKPTKEDRLKKRLEREKLKVKKARQPKLSTLKETAQKVVNKRIRERDIDEPCISCGKYDKNKQAGHFWPQGSKGFLRYHPDNLHGQCHNCNHWKSGNLLEYRISLVKKIGEERVQWLDDNRSAIMSWTREDLIKIKKGTYEYEV